MQEDFHYYATYCAAVLAGYSHEESLAVSYSAQFVDLCSQSFLDAVGGPASAATTMLQLEMMDTNTDVVGLQMITRIWSSFHFLPYDLYAKRKKCSRRYLNKYRLICRPNGDLLVDTVTLAKNKGPAAAGIAMHILADTWAHQYFAGTPSLVINNTDRYFTEILADGQERRVTFRHAPGVPDNLKKGLYTNTLFQFNENSVMNLGHGRAGHLPDYSFIRYKYQPAWMDYEECSKDNPSDYYHAFCQMVYALRYLRGDYETFETDTYDFDTVKPWQEEIYRILTKVQLDASDDWKVFGQKLSGMEIEAFHIGKYQEEYRKAGREEKDGTYLGQFFLAAMAQKSMVTNRIFKSGNLLAGFSVDFVEKGFRGIRDYLALLREQRKGGNDDKAAKSE